MEKPQRTGKPTAPAQLLPGQLSHLWVVAGFLTKRVVVRLSPGFLAQVELLSSCFAEQM